MPTCASARSVDWQVVEDALFVVASQYVPAFAACHSQERFYGFAIDCNAHYCQVSACLNTKEDLQQQVERYRTRRPDSYGPMTVAQVEARLRWSLGDWRYQALTTDRFSEAWAPVEEALMDTLWAEEEEPVSLEDFAASFMETACRAMVGLEGERVLDALPRTDDFATFVADHDELDETSWRRLESVRRHGAEA